MSEVASAEPSRAHWSWRPDQACLDYWADVRAGIAAKSPHTYRNDDAEAMRDRASGLIAGAFSMLREANDLMARARELETDAAVHKSIRALADKEDG